MRRPIPPVATLNQNGNVLAYRIEQTLHLVELESGSETTVPLPHVSERIALSPYGLVGVLAGDGYLTRFRYEADVTLDAPLTLAAPLFRAAVGDDGRVGGILQADEASAALGVWQGDPLLPVLGEDGTALGQVAAYHIRLDEQRQRVLVWGLAGAKAHAGEGLPYVRLFVMAGKQAEVRWDGEDMPFTRRGFLYPLPDGAIGIYDRDRVAVMPINEHGAVQTAPLVEHTLHNLERVAFSPNGQFITWLWSDDDNIHHLHTADFNTGRPAQATTFDHLGRFPSLAVSDAGRATLVYSEPPDRVYAYFAHDDGLQPCYISEDKQG
jgi:hypothetical protein